MITVNPIHHIIVNQPRHGIALNWKPELDLDKLLYHRFRLCREIEWDGFLHLEVVGRENVLSDYMSLHSYIMEGRSIVLRLDLVDTEVWLSVGLSNFNDFIHLLALQAAYQMDPKFKL